MLPGHPVDDVAVADDRRPGGDLGECSEQRDVFVEHADPAVRVRQELDPAGVGQPGQVTGDRGCLGQAEAMRQLRPARRHAVAPDVCFDAVEHFLLPVRQFPHGVDLLRELQTLALLRSTRPEVYTLPDAMTTYHKHGEEKVDVCN